MDQNSTNNNLKTFTQKVWISAAIGALFFTVIWFFTTTFNVLLLILAGSLIAFYFHGISKWIHKKTHLPNKGSLAISVIGTVLLLGSLIYFTGSKIENQISQLSDTLPATVDNFKNQLNKSPLGQKIVKKISSDKTKTKAVAVIKSFFRSTFGVLGDVYVVLFIGIFFTVSPHIYTKGFLLLIPPNAKDKAKQTLSRTGFVLTKWLKGKIFAMIIVAVLTLIGLLILGVPMALTLSLIAGILNFVPNFGPLIAMIPAVLVGLMQGPDTALIIVAIYLGVQILESNFITPSIQKKLISIPPALIIIAQLFMGILTGGWGVVLATPLTAILMVILEETYVKNQNKKLPSGSKQKE